MNEFRNATYKKVLYGSKLEFDDEFTLQLTLCPMGWRKEGCMELYIELIDIDKNKIECIQATLTIYIKELDLLYKTSMEYCNVKNAIGINSVLYTFERVSKFDSLSIECHVDLIYVGYRHKMELEPLILSISTKIPQIKDTEFRWNIDGGLLTKIKNTEENWVYYSDNFMNNCLTLLCTKYENTYELGLKLLRIPYNVEGYIVTVIWKIISDRWVMVIKRRKKIGFGLE